MKKYLRSKALILPSFSKDSIQRSTALLLEYMFQKMEEDKNDIVDFEITSTKEGIRIRFDKNR